MSGTTVQSIVLVFPLPRSRLDVTDYSIKWNDWLAPFGDQLATVVWSIVPIGRTPTQSDCTVVGAQPPFDPEGTATCIVSGGVANTVYDLMCSVTTVGGRAASRYATLRTVA